MATMRSNIAALPKKVNSELPYDPAIPLGIITHAHTHTYTTKPGF